MILLLHPCEGPAGAAGSCMIDTSYLLTQLTPMIFTLASYYNSTKVKVKGHFSADYAVCLTSAP